MTKRSQWVAVCWFWAVVWFLAGGVLAPIGVLLFWPLAVVSALLIMLPIGVPDVPSPKHYPNPGEWSKHGNGPRT